MIPRLTDLTDPAARAAAAAYFSRVDRVLAALPRELAELERGELEAHVLDAIGHAADVDETALAAALDRLGRPEAFLPGVVATQLRRRAGTSFNPGDVAVALIRGASAGLAQMTISTLVGLGYALALGAVVMGVLSLIFPDTVGVFRLDDGTLLIGGDSEIAGHRALGGYFGPLALVSGAALYAALTWIYGRLAAPDPKT